MTSLVGKTIGLHPIVSLAALIATAELFGIAGALLASPMAGVLQALLIASTLFHEHDQKGRGSCMKEGSIRATSSQVIQVEAPLIHLETRHMPDEDAAFEAWVLEQWLDDGGTWGSVPDDENLTHEEVLKPFQTKAAGTSVH